VNRLDGGLLSNEVTTKGLNNMMFVNAELKTNRTNPSKYSCRCECVKGKG